MQFAIISQRNQLYKYEDIKSHRHEFVTVRTFRFDRGGKARRLLPLAKWEVPHQISAFAIGEHALVHSFFITTSLVSILRGAFQSFPK